MTRTIALAALVAIAGSAAQATTLWQCQLDRVDTDVISPRILIAHDEVNSLALVNDALIKTFMKTPQQATVAGTGTAHVFQWSLTVTDADGRNAVVSYVATVDKAEPHAIEVGVAVNGMSRGDTGSGACTRVEK